MAADSQRCTATRTDGQPCEAPARPGRSYCAFHDPELAEQRADARRRGGQRRSQKAAVLSSDAPDLPLQTVGDVTRLLADTINQCRRGQLDPRVGNCLGYLASVMVRAIEGSETERRLAAIEEQMAQTRPAGRRAM
jgi:hypothetical protein